MTSRSNVVLGLMVGAGALVALGAVSRISYVAEPNTHALVRLAWRMPGARVRDCRHRTAEEMAKLPVHMREGEVCERRILPYLLTVYLDQSRDSIMVRASGIHQDRPLYVYREMSVAPGDHRISVVFE